MITPYRQISSWYAKCVKRGYQLSKETKNRLERGADYFDSPYEPWCDWVRKDVLFAEFIKDTNSSCGKGTFTRYLRLINPQLKTTNNIKYVWK